MNRFNSHPELSIIIINYNTKKITQQCLFSLINSLRGDEISYEIVLIDNASKDGSLKYFSSLAKKYPHLRYVYNKENLGYSKGNNQGVKLALGEYIIFLNSDTIILNKAINKLFSYYKTNEKKIHFLGPKLLNIDFTPQPSAGHFFNLLTVFAVLFLKGDKIGLTRFSPAKIKRVDWISGACILTKKKIIEQLNGFDEKIFMYMDEIDLMYRAKKQNYSVYFYPEAKIIHYGSASSSKTYPILQLYRGLIYFYKKHYSRTALLILKFMLYIKTKMAIFIGKVIKNYYLTTTYSQANKLLGKEKF